MLEKTHTFSSKKRPNVNLKIQTKEPKNCQKGPSEKLDFAIF
jgi:hypothetical protein